MIYFFLPILLFLIFIIIISIFGFSILKIFKNNSNNFIINLDIIQTFIISFGLGLSSYLLLSILIASFRIINFFTLNLPIIIIDLVFITYSLKKNKIRIKKRIKSFFEILKKFVIKKNNIIMIIGVLILIILYLIININFIFSKKSLYVADPFHWFEYITSTIRNGYINNKFIKPTYPPGYSMLCITQLSFLIQTDYLVIYYYLKFMPIPFTIFFIILFAFLLKKILKKNIYIFIGLIMITRANFLNYRFLRFLPSNFATLLILISIFFLLNKIPFYLNALILVGIYLINPLVSFYYIFSLVIYFIFIMLSQKKFKIKIMKTGLKYIFIVILYLLPYFVLLLSYNYNLFEILTTYFRTLGILEDIKLLNLNLIENNLILISSEIIEGLLAWFPNEPWYLKLRLKNSSLIFSPLFIFAIIGFFIPIRRFKNPNKKFLFYFKSCFLIIIILIFLPNIIPTSIIFNYWPYQWIIRILEPFCVPIILLEIISLKFLISKISNTTLYLKLKKNNFIENKFKKSFKIKSILTLFLLIFSFIFYYLENDNDVIYSDSWSLKTGYPGKSGYYFEDEQIDSIFYIKDHIKPQDLLVPNFTFNLPKNRIYLLIWEYNKILWDYNIPNSYEETKALLLFQNLSYLLIDFRYINDTEVLNFKIDDKFEVIYENDINIFLKFNNS